MLRPASFAAAALLLATPARGQDRTAEIDRIFGFASAETPGCAVGVSQHGRVVVDRTYGLADVERRVPLGRRSAFDIGSAQKQFVAAAVLLLVADGRLSLSDDVRKHLPELPDYGHTVTVDHLLTHTSGVRDWTGLLPLAEPGAEVLPLILRQRGLNFAPGEAWAYSNSGYVLLKEIVARASGTSFAEFARRRLFAPLGMTSSAYVADILHAAGDRALGYQREGAGWKPYMRLGSRRGGGAVISTAGDLLRWNDALTGKRLGAFVTAKLQEPTTLRNGRTLGYARGLMLDRHGGGPLVSHSGGAAGFSTWLGRLPRQGLSVAVLCNFDPVSATALARRVADLYLPAGGEQAEAAAAAGAPGVDVSARAGLFFDERTGEPMRLLVHDGGLRIANGPPLVAVAPDRFRNRRGDLFFRSQDEFELRFVAPDRLELRSMEGRPPGTGAPGLDARGGRPAGRRRPVRERGARVRGRSRPRDQRDRAAPRAFAGAVAGADRGRTRHVHARHDGRTLPARRGRHGRGLRLRQPARARRRVHAAGRPAGRRVRGDAGDGSGPAARRRRAPTSGAPTSGAPTRRGSRGSRASTSWRPGARSRSRSTAAGSTGSRRAARKRPLAHVSGSTFSAAGSPVDPDVRARRRRACDRGGDAAER
jgi:CubicO group peptidase (beta-lactamase class C family)